MILLAEWAITVIEYVAALENNVISENKIRACLHAPLLENNVISETANLAKLSRSAVLAARSGAVERLTSSRTTRTTTILKGEESRHVTRN